MRAISSRGSVYTLESAIAILIMVTVLALVISRPSNETEFDVVNYKLRVYNALKISDDVGSLRNDVLAENATAIEEDVEESIQSAYNYDVVIYNKTSALTEEPTIESNNVVTVSYFLSGNEGSYNPREIRVYIWGYE